MAFTKAFKITKEPRTFQAGESTGFQLSLGSQYYDRKTKQKEWANYKAVVFAKGNQLGFYQQSLVVGTIIELSADDLKIDNYNPEYLSIELIDARVGGIFTGNAPQQAPQQQQYAPQQSAPQQNQQQPQYNEPPVDFDDEIPF
ncbi:single strand DNA binding protein [Vibrio phage 209E38-1]